MIIKISFSKMETIKLIPEDLQAKFKTKRDLYDLLSIDCKH